LETVPQFGQSSLAGKMKPSRTDVKTMLEPANPGEVRRQLGELSDRKALPVAVSRGIHRRTVISET
jgi:hypothetical protein